MPTKIIKIKINLFYFNMTITEIGDLLEAK